MSALPTWISAELLMWSFGILLSVIGALVLNIFFRLNKTADRIETKVDALEMKNAQDHAIVQGRLSSLDERTEALHEAVNGLRRDVDSIHEDVIKLDKQVSVLRGSVN